MRDACEALRLIGEDGLAISNGSNAVPPPGARDPAFVSIERTSGKEKSTESIDVKAFAERQKQVGRLFRTSMNKTGLWEGVPIEYARAQTDTPPK